MSLGRIIRTTASGLYIADKFKLLPSGKKIDYVNPKHKNYIYWNLALVSGLTLEVLGFFNFLFLPIGEGILLVCLFNKDRKISYCLESLEKACKVGNTRLIKHYRAKAERLLNGR